MEISHEQLDKILADFSALGRATYLDDPVLDFGYAATDLDDLGIPRFSPELPRIPVALVERHRRCGPTRTTTDRSRKSGLSRRCRRECGASVPPGSASCPTWTGG